MLGRAVPSSHPALPLRPLALAISLALGAGMAHGAQRAAPDGGHRVQGVHHVGR